MQLLDGLFVAQLRRTSHHTIAVNHDSLYLWGGILTGRKFSDNVVRNSLYEVQHFSLATGEWVSKGTTGSPPCGLIGYSCSAIADQVFYFGGFFSILNTQRGLYPDYHNSITKLDIASLQWEELQPTDPDLPVMRRAFSGMVLFDCNGKHYLLIIGGEGHAPAIRIPGTTYLYPEDSVKIDPTTLCQTNELSLYNLSSSNLHVILITACALIRSTIVSLQLPQIEHKSNFK